MSAVLITGATSYLGQALGRRSASDGNEVHVLVRASSDRSRFADWPRQPRFHTIDGSLESLVGAFEAARADVVFHLATHYVRDHRPEDVSALIDANIRLGTHLLEAMVATGCRRLVHSASFFQHFDSDSYRPLNLYAATKQAFEDIELYYVDSGLIDSVCAVFFEVYGPGDWRKKVVPALLAAQREDRPIDLADPTQVLNLVFVEDAVEALLRMAQTDGAVSPRGGRARFAVRAPENITLEHLVQVFESVNGRPIKANWNAYPTPARSIENPWPGPAVPGWQPKTGLPEGIAMISGRGT